MTTAKNIYDYINKIAPFEKQEEWDNSGFLVGNFRKEVKKVLLTLDVTKEVAEYAKSINADLIISHHPVIFKPLSSVQSGTVVYTCLENNIAVISAHTSFDVADGGINDLLAKRLELLDVRKTEDGFLRVGKLDNVMSIDDFAEYVSEKLNVSGLRYTDTEKEIKEVAVCGGAGADYIQYAMKEADAFVTGDLKYHEMLDASENDFAVISAGHFETEAESFHLFMDNLSQIFTDVEFIWSDQKNPIMAV